jgi:hypothetical protein
MPTTPAPVVGGHVWLASGLSIVILLFATWALYGFNHSLLLRLVIGADNRASTSKFQATVWTYAILFALVTLLVGHLIYADFDPGWNTFLDDGLNSDYLWLLGIPSVGLVGAKAITQSKVERNPDAKPSKPDDADANAKPGGADANVLARVRTRTRELASNDNDKDPQPALGDLQYLVFNAVAVTYFLSAFLAHVERGLPSLPDTLIALTGVSAASYLSAKGVAKAAAPVIVSVRPSRVVLGRAPTPLTVSGTGLLGATGTGGAPGATLDGVELVVAGPSAEGLTAMVPDTREATAKGLVAGKLPLIVYTPGGQPSEPTTIEVS